MCFLNELLPKASSINPVTGACFVCMLSANLNKQIPPVASLSQSQNQHGKELRGNLEEFLRGTLQRAGGVHPLWNLRNRQVQGVYQLHPRAVDPGCPRGMAGFIKGSSRAVSGKDKPLMNGSL